MGVATIKQNISKFLEDMPNSRKMSMPGAVIRIAYNYVLYGAGVTDFFLYRFYEKSGKEKRKYITHGDRVYLMNHVNDENYVDRFENKAEFRKYYGEFLNREIFHLKNNRQEYLDFAEKQLASGGALIYKPVDGNSGKGIFTLQAGDPHVTDWDWLTAQDDDMVVEKVLQNHPAIAVFNPDSLNTLRILVLLQKNGEFQVIGSYLRMGRKGVHIDNFNSGGVCCEVDVKTGKICTPAVNKTGHYFDKHPDSQIPFMGFSIPYYEEVKQMALDAAKLCPAVKYSAWDIAILEDGPIMIEGNYCGDLDVLQAPADEGRRYLFEDYLPKRRLFFGDKHLLGKAVSVSRDY